MFIYLFVDLYGVFLDVVFHVLGAFGSDLAWGILWVFRFGLFGDCDSRFGVMVVICCLICVVLWMLGFVF